MSGRVDEYIVEHTAGCVQEDTIVTVLGGRGRYVGGYEALEETVGILAVEGEEATGRERGMGG